MKPFDLNGLKTYELRSRPSKVFVEDLGQPVDAATPVGEWLDALPRQLAGNVLRRVRDHLCRAFFGRYKVECVRGHGYFLLGHSSLAKTLDDVSIHAPGHRADESFRGRRRK